MPCVRCVRARWHGGRPNPPASAWKGFGCGGTMHAVVNFPPAGMAMKIELTDQQEQAAAQGLPVEVVNPATNRAYLMIAKETFQSLQGTVSDARGAAVDNRPIPPGVERS